MQMKKAVNQTLFISLFLDTRRTKENGLFPVKLRVFYKPTRKQKLYATKFELSKKDYKSIWLTVKPRQDYKESKKEMQALLSHAEYVAEELQKFTFEIFEKKLFEKASEGHNVFYQYEQIIQELKDKNCFGTAMNYELSRKSLKSFITHRTGKEPLKLLFADISPTWLEKYEQYMTGTMNRSRTTVSMYLRALRTVFNVSISRNEIEPEIYPFFLKKSNNYGYKIPSASGTKKALSKTDLRKLFDAPAKTPEQQKAKDFWFFSYSCNGMNIKDIALLRYKDLNNDSIQFYRAKTINTNKESLKLTTIYLNDFTRSVIEKYGNPDKQVNKFIFSIIDEFQIEYKKHLAVKNFTRFVNQHLKDLATSVGITSDISTYWARHSFATNAIRSGVKMEFVSEALSHRNLKTTQDYFAGFEDIEKRKLSEGIMDF